MAKQNSLSAEYISSLRMFRYMDFLGLLRQNIANFDYSNSQWDAEVRKSRNGIGL